MNRVDRSARLFVVAAALLGLVSVAAGAFGAHALGGAISPQRLEVFRTGARYQMYHALALLVVGYASMHCRDSWLTGAGWLFAGGTVLFSGSLYALVLTDTPAYGAVTPIGGVALLAGWLALAVAGFRMRTTAKD